MTTPTVNQLIELKGAVPQLEQLTLMCVAVDDRRLLPIHSIEVREGRAIVRFGSSESLIWRTLSEFLAERCTLFPRPFAGPIEPGDAKTPTEKQLLRLPRYSYRRGDKAWNLVLGWPGDRTEDVIAFAWCGDQLVRLNGFAELSAWIDGADEIIRAEPREGGAA